MPARPATGSKKSKKLKVRKAEADEVIIDPLQEQIDGLIREREEIRSKLNTICSKIIDNINIDNYPKDIDLTKQQPSDISLDHLLIMLEEICDYRTAFLNLYQETDAQQNIPVQKKITQLSVEDPSLFRKRLTADQRLTFVARERDLWKENAELLQIMYATIVDQLEMGIFKKINVKTNEILQAHRLNLEDVCLIFLLHSFDRVGYLEELYNFRRTDSIYVVHDAGKFREKKELKTQQVSSDLHEEEISNTNLHESKEHPVNSLPKMKRNVSFADEVNIIYDNKDNDRQEIKIENPSKEKSLPSKPRLPLASDTLIENMDSNLRMMIVKELSKDSKAPQPSSRKGSAYSPNTRDSQPNRSRKKVPEWVSLARLIGIDESEIDHWLSQSLQYPAGRVLSTWCNSTSPSPTVAELHSLVSSNELNRLDLAREIEAMYSI